MSESFAKALKILCAPFPDDVIGVKVQSLNKDKTKALLVLYLQHTVVADRLDSVDTDWSFSMMPLTSEQRIDRNGHMDTFKTVLGTMTVLGIKRDNFGEGETPKEAASDCLKRCAMLFGVGRYLYDQEMAWVPYNESQDKYRRWTIEDIKKSNGEANRASNEIPRWMSDPKTIIVPAGRDKGKMLSELTEDQVRQDANYWRRREHSEGKALTGKLAEYVLACELLIEKYSKGSPPPSQWTPPPMDESDVP